MKKLLTILPLVALSATTFAETWSYDPSNDINNTLEDNLTPTGEMIIDVTEGSLAVTGHFENKGTVTIQGANTIDAAGNVTKSEHVFDISTQNQHNRNTLILKNVNIKNGNIYNENGSGNPLMEIHGYVTFSNNVYTKQNGVVLIKEGARLDSHYFIIENNNGVLRFENATSKQLVNTWEFRNDSTAIYDFNLSNDSLECVDGDTAVVYARFIKTLNGKIELDLTNFVLSEDFVAGETYKIALFNSYSNEVASGQFDDTWKILAENVTNGEFAQFAGYLKEGNVLYAQVKAIPEPSTYAAIFGALALAFVAYRRRK